MSTPSRYDIRKLSTEAGEAGDLAMVAVCELALNGWSDAVDMGDLAQTGIRNQERAIAECARVIADAAASADK